MCYFMDEPRLQARWPRCFARINIKIFYRLPNRQERRDVLIYGKGKDPGGLLPRVSERL